MTVAKVFWGCVLALVFVTFLQAIYISFTPLGRQLARDLAISSSDNDPAVPRQTKVSVGQQTGLHGCLLNHKPGELYKCSGSSTGYCECRGD